MLAPSVKRMPLQPLAEARSEPARSIIDSFMIFTLRLSLLVIRMYTWKTECERDDSALASVGCWVLFLFPCAIRANRLSAFVIQWIESPGIRTSDVLTSIRESELDGWIRSRTFSLYTCPVQIQLKMCYRKVMGMFCNCYREVTKLLATYRRGATGKLLSTPRETQSIFYQFQKEWQWLKLWISSLRSKCFWKKHNAPWLFWAKPGTDHAVLNAAKYSVREPG